MLVFKLFGVIVVGLATALPSNAANSSRSPLSDLHDAIRSNNLALVKTSLNKGADINGINQSSTLEFSGDGKGASPLLHAIQKQHGPIAQYLIEQGADIEQVCTANDIYIDRDRCRVGNIHPVNPLTLAVHMNQTKMTKLLIDKGAKVMMKDYQYKRTLVQWAILHQNLNLLKEVCRLKPNLSEPDREGKTAADYLAQSTGWIDHQKATVLLFPSGIKRDIWSSLSTNDTEALSRLLTDDPTLVNARDSEQNTPLHRAIELLNTNAVNILIDKKSNVNALNNYGQCPLHMVATGLAKANNNRWNSHVRTGHMVPDALIILNLLLGQKPELNSQDSSGQSPLFYLALKVSDHFPEGIVALYEAGADPFLVPPRYNRNELLAILGPRSNINPKQRASITLPLLISKGLPYDTGSINGPDQLIHCAVRYGDETLLVALIKRGASLDTPNQEGFTGYHLAIATDREEWLKNIISDNNFSQVFPSDNPAALRRARIAKLDIQFEKSYFRPKTKDESINRLFSLIRQYIDEDPEITQQAIQFNSRICSLLSCARTKEMAQFILNHGGKFLLNSTPVLSQIQLANSADSNQFQAIELLLEHGANPNKSTNGFPPLYHAINAQCPNQNGKGNAALVEILLKNGASLKLDFPQNSGVYGSSLFDLTQNEDILNVIRKYQSRDEIK